MSGPEAVRTFSDEICIHAIQIRRHADADRTRLPWANCCMCATAKIAFVQISSGTYAIQICIHADSACIDTISVCMDADEKCRPAFGGACLQPKKAWVQFPLAWVPAEIACMQTKKTSMPAESASMQFPYAWMQISTARHQTGFALQETRASPCSPAPDAMPTAVRGRLSVGLTLRTPGASILTRTLSHSLRRMDLPRRRFLVQPGQEP